MRFFEIMIILSLVATLVSPLLLRRVERWMLLFNAATFLFLILHLFIEKYRWQMVPLYVLAVLSALAAFAAPATAASIGRWRTTAYIAGLVLVVPAALLPVLFPVPHVPKPTGEYPVATLNRRLNVRAGRPDSAIIRVTGFGTA